MSEEIRQFLRGQIPPAQRSAYLSRDKVVAAASEPRVLRALAQELQLELKAPISKSSSEVLFSAIWRRLTSESLDPTSRFHGSGPAEILAARVLRCEALSDRYVETLFDDVGHERELCEPVAEWLVQQFGCQKVVSEIGMGTKTADLVGIRTFTTGGFFGETIEEYIAVELKADPKEFERAPDQVTNYHHFCSAVYVAFTPFMGALVLSAHCDARGQRSGWEPNFLARKAELLRCGTLLVEGTSVTHLTEAPRRRLAEPELRVVRKLTDVPARRVVRPLSPTEKGSHT